MVTLPRAEVMAESTGREGVAYVRIVSEGVIIFSGSVERGRLGPAIQTATIGLEDVLRNALERELEAAW